MSRSQQIWLQMPHMQYAEPDSRLYTTSPRCSLDCNGMSTHLPPLNEQRRASQATYMTPPVSAHAYYASFDDRRPSYDMAAYASLVQNNGRRISKADTTYSTDRSTWSQDVSRESSLLPGPPGVARRAKAHVPSACVNCKKKHLACETKRPCGRCIANGKEHKKRGRPRLREDEREKATVPLPSASSSQSRGYRELRSQPESYAPPTFDSAPMLLLTTDCVVAHYNQAFADALGLRVSIHHQRLEDLVVPADKDKLRRLQASIGSELQSVLHSAYRYGLAESLHSVAPPLDRLDTLHATAGFQARSEYITFRPSQPGHSPAFLISLSLARETGHFLILTLLQAVPSVPEYLPIGGIPSPPNSTYGARYQRDSPPEIAYHLSQNIPLGYEELQRRVGSPPRHMPVAAYGTPSTKSHSSANSLSGSEMQRQSPQELKHEHLQHLQLPPIRAGPTSDPSRGTEHSAKHENSTPSPSRGSPSSSKRKRRRRLDIGDVLQ